jgi:hypothetical protein
VVPKRNAEILRRQKKQMEENHVVTPSLKTTSFNRFEENRVLTPQPPLQSLSLSSSPTIPPSLPSTTSFSNDILITHSIHSSSPLTNTSSTTTTTTTTAATSATSATSTNNNNNNNNNKQNDVESRELMTATTDSDSDYYLDAMDNFQEFDETILSNLQNKLQTQLQQQLEEQKKHMTTQYEVLEKRILQLQETVDKMNERIANLERDVQLLTTAHAHESLHDERFFPFWLGAHRKNKEGARGKRSWTMFALAIFWPLLLWLMYKFIQKRTAHVPRLPLKK